MGKYSGFIGFAENREVEPSIWEDVITERHYYGDIVRNVSRYNQNNTLSGENLITNSFSIMGDTFAFQNYTKIRYLTWQHTRWVVTSIEEQYPRLIMNIGGIYNGPTPKSRCHAEDD